MWELCSHVCANSRVPWSWGLRLDRSWAQRAWPWIPQWLPPGSPQSDRWRAHLPRGHAQALDGLQSVIPGRAGESPQSRPRYVYSAWPPMSTLKGKLQGKFYRFVSIFNDHSSSMEFFLFQLTCQFSTNSIKALIPWGAEEAHSGGHYYYLATY